ncbi:pseudouridine synthase [Clostridium cylindrosporum]|uniref:Pseudouridine synthase n=1 Tax=Clostridium cylindrosporum DSM 605 TaxID=1121307 RepID=A0A0J8G0R1_CLOCY|nr:pseudouridine synthase [Clostridium cylindrosporum]KMT21381.1 ribosomal large subunit pseudouridine synthase B [Clostridium cylindrosporum DSM 605]
MKERLQKFLAKSGVCSRRKAEEFIFNKRVKVNGDIVENIVLVDPDLDIIEVDGKRVCYEEKKVYIILNKPVGIITSSKDQFDRKTVVDIVNVEERVFSVGRLDYDTSGLLILTNDGDLSYKMTHPSHEVNKTYIALVEGIPSEEELERFRNGLEIEDYITSPASIKIINKVKGKSTLEIVIHEGKNRQVRKMCSAIGHDVITLKREKIGNLSLKGLEIGKWRYLNQDEIDYIKSI